MKEKEIIINGEKYIHESAAGVKPASDWNGLPFAIVRTYSAGVFAGYIEKKDGKEVVLRNVRRIWYWAGAYSLSQLAMEGTSKPDQCKFAVAVDRITVTEAIEILDCTEKAQKSIEGVKEWRK